MNQWERKARRVSRDEAWRSYGGDVLGLYGGCELL
jgi:hypothetical protein